MKIPSPQDCGLPEKFVAWRPAQVEALRLLLSRTVRIQALEAPTGFGKTALYVAWALLTKLPTAFITESRALQDQLMREFGEVGMVDLRGRQNYKCSARPDWTCEEGYAARCMYKNTPACESSYAEMRAGISFLVVTNYDKWTSNRKFGQGLQHIQQVVFDEGHKAVDALSRAMQVTLHEKEVAKTLGVDFPSPSRAEDMVNWRPWASEARGAAEQMMLAVKQSIFDAGPAAKPAWIRQFIHLRNLVRRLATLATAVSQDWVVDEVKGGYQFDPIRPGRYAEGALLLRVPSILFVSATLRPKTMYLLGLPKESFTYQEFPSDFPADRCPIYYVPTMRVDSKADSLAPLWLKLDQIVSRRKDRSGIVHTISYARRDEILSTSRYSDRMIINTRGEASGPIVEQFKEAPRGTILVSPSVSAGFDFPGEECEYQFVCKIPFPDGRSKIQQARQANDKEYGAYQAMTALVQIFGRGMRSAEDRCENFICDSHLDWFLPRFGHLAPRWFNNFFQRVESLPSPPPRL